MATPRKRGDRWHIEVYRLGQRRAKSFDTKRAAQHWAAVTIADITARHERGEYDRTGPGIRTVGNMFDRYLTEVTPTKRGARNETARLRRMLRDPLATVPLATLSTTDIAEWRDRRLKEVSNASVARDINLLSAVIMRAMKEWQWLTANPLTGVQRPKEPPSRERRITDAEIRAFAHVCAFDLDSDQPAITGPQRVCAAFLFAVETAMRAGEICNLAPDDIKGSVARLHMTKNGYGRDVPLSPAALAILARLPADTLFGLKAGSLDAMFRKYRDKAGIEGLHFHDARHEAVTRLAQRIDVLDLARMTGHRDIRMLMRYFHRDAASVAEQLKRPSP